MAHITSPTQDPLRQVKQTARVRTRISVNTRATWYQSSPDEPHSSTVIERVHEIAQAEFRRFHQLRTVEVRAARAGCVDFVERIEAGQHCSSCSCMEALRAPNFHGLWPLPVSLGERATPPRTPQPDSATRGDTGAHSVPVVAESISHGVARTSPAQPGASAETGKERLERGQENMTSQDSLTWTAGPGYLFATDDHGRYVIERHGQGRKFWGVTFPDGTYRHNALTQAAAKLQAELWEPDPQLVQLVELVEYGAQRHEYDDVQYVEAGEQSGGTDDNAGDDASSDADETPAVAAGNPSDESDDHAGDGGQDFVTIVDESQEVVTSSWGTDRERSDRVKEFRRHALAQLPAAVEARARIDADIARLVEEARTPNPHAYYDYGMPTWEQIGKALGVTKQSAQAKYGKKPGS